MAFREQGAWVTLLAMLVVYGWYFADVAATAMSTPVAEIDYQPSLYIMIGVLVGVIIIGQVGIAIYATGTAGRGAEILDELDEMPDERDRLIETRADAFSSHFIAIAAFGAMFQVMAGWPGFWVAHTLLAGLVVMGIAKSVWVLLAYRRGS
tara:strand:+ start:1360 stop:1812 length:453 start_codon:yes stop_codon:yes gene_type:complete